jgi:Acetyltransferase (GNAT) domain
MHGTHCIDCEDLEPEERLAVEQALARDGLPLSMLWFFDALVAMGRGRADFVFHYVKVFFGERLVGVAMIGVCRRFDRAAMLSPSHPILRRAVATLDCLPLASKTLFFCFGEMFTMNIGPAFVAIRASDAAELRAAVARHVLNRMDSDLVVILDDPVFQATYEEANFIALPFASNVSIDVDDLLDASAFLDCHRKTRQKLRHLDRANVHIEHRADGVDEAEKAQMRDCLLQSARHSRTPTPFQLFYNNDILGGAWMNTSGAVHTLLRLDGRIVAFASNFRCGRDLGGIMGGIDRRYSRGLPVYDRLIVAEVEFAVANGISRMHYGIANNETKIRLVNRFDPVFAYVGARRRLDRLSLLALYPFTSLFEVARFEQRVRAGRVKRHLSPPQPSKSGEKT